MLFFDPFGRLSWVPLVSRGPIRIKAHFDWIETPSSHLFKINVPGFSREEIKIQLEEGNVLHVSAEGAKEEPLPKEAIWHVSGRERGHFSREIVLPDNVKVEQIKAQVDNGVLTILVPKDATRTGSINIPISSKL